MTNERIAALRHIEQANAPYGKVDVSLFCEALDLAEQLQARVRELEKPRCQPGCPNADGSLGWECHGCAISLAEVLVEPKTCSDHEEDET